MSSQPPVICVLGMHRSGTSCLAGSLEHYGVFFGNVQQANRHNQKGNRERIDVNRLNELVLAESGGSWHEPPASIRWTPGHARMRDEILQTYLDATDGPWGFKDPRFTFTLPFWREALSDLRIVASFRHPAAVAFSLARRNQFTLTKSLSIWSEYNQQLLARLIKSPFPLISFDAPDDEYRHSLRVVAGYLGLTTDSPTEEFFDPDLRHHSPPATTGTASALPRDVESLYLGLMQHYRAMLIGTP